MSNIPFRLLLFSLYCVLNATSQGEIFFSTKYGFIAEFRSKPEQGEMKLPSGDTASFWVVNKDPFLLLTVNAQKMKMYADFVDKRQTDAVIKEAIMDSIRAVRVIESWDDVDLEWVKNTDFPVLKASFSQAGLLGDDRKVFELSYWMLLGDTFYRVKAQGLDPKKLETQIQELYQSFMVVDAEVLEKLVQTVKKPSETKS